MATTSTITTVPLEELAWVLEPERLCLPVTGKRKEQMEMEMDLFLPGKEGLMTHRGAMQAKQQLVQYFVAQLRLFAAMCRGRSYNCIHWLQRSFDYTVLVSVCVNDRLPALVRAAATDLVRALYVDRYPQLHNCGRASLPEVLWVFDGVRELEAGAEGSGVSVIRDQALTSPGALPGFGLGAHHPFALLSEDRTLSFPTQFKFFLLRHVHATVFFTGYPRCRQGWGDGGGEVGRQSLFGLGGESS